MGTWLFFLKNWLFFNGFYLHPCDLIYIIFTKENLLLKTFNDTMLSFPRLFPHLKRGGIFESRETFQKKDYNVPRKVLHSLRVFDFSKRKLKVFKKEKKKQGFI